jgi:hypothetical protein
MMVPCWIEDPNSQELIARLIVVKIENIMNCAGIKYAFLLDRRS